MKRVDALQLTKLHLFARLLPTIYSHWSYMCHYEAKVIFILQNRFLYKLALLLNVVFCLSESN